MQRYLARSDRRRKQRPVVRTNGRGDEQRNCVVHEQHDFAANTQMVVHTRTIYQYIHLSVYLYIYLSVYLSIYSSIYLSPHPSVRR